MFYINNQDVLTVGKKQKMSVMKRRRNAKKKSSSK